MEESLINIRFVVSVVVLFVWALIAGMVVHGVLLGTEYIALTQLYRAEADQMAYFPYMLMAHLSMTIGITWIYRMERNDGQHGLAPGVRFGIARVPLMTVSICRIYFAIQPMPSGLAARQIGFRSIAVVLTGIITAFVNR